MENESKDYLTGLYTRQALYDMFDRMEAGSIFHFMFIDLDNFKSVNDVYGHNEGDVLLKAVARIMQESAPTARAIRLGGDEFVLLFQSECAREDLCTIAENIIERISRKESFEHISVYVSASVGILYHEKVDGKLDDFLLKSDKAMYYAKTHGKSRAVVFNDIADGVMEEIAMEKMQQEALATGKFELRFLPIIGAQTTRVKMTQARLVWKLSEEEEKSQEDFLPLFEKNGFIRELDIWLIHKVFYYLKQYHTKWQQPTRVGMRISRLTLLEKDFAHRMKKLADTHGIAPKEVDIEVDERVFDNASVELFVCMELLKGYGFGLSVVGVGSEFKSIKYWDMIEFNSIIFDSDFVKKSLSSNRGRKILRTMLEMGRQLNMEVTVDGVVSREAVVFFGDYGCNLVGGVLYPTPFHQSDYWKYLTDKMDGEEEKIVFPFCKDFKSTDGKYEGAVNGEGICLAEGISDKWGSVYFPGGPVATHIVELPTDVLAENSYTICMWLKPLEETSWTSVIFVGCENSFMTFSPFVAGGISIFRMCEILEVNGFHDAFARPIPKDIWTFVSLTYDEATGISRVYVNGFYSGKVENVPRLLSRIDIFLGGDRYQPSYQGYISGLQFYGYVKSTEEIKEIYESFKEEEGFRG